MEELNKRKREANKRWYLRNKENLKNKREEKQEKQAIVTKKPLLIAEIGINHDGSIQKAKQLIILAKNSGADIAKFQAYSVEDLFGKTGIEPNEDIYNKVRHTEFNKDQFRELKDFCEGIQIEFMCSVFDRERYQWMQDLHVKRHKIASRVSLWHEQGKKLPNSKMTLAELIASSGKETFMSLGLSQKRLPVKYSDTVRYLFCKSKYPCYPEDYIDLPDKFEDHWYGLSDHSGNIIAALISLARGAKVVELHLKNNYSYEGVDSTSSVCPQDLQHLSQLMVLMYQYL